MKRLLLGSFGLLGIVVSAACADDDASSPSTSSSSSSSSSSGAVPDGGGGPADASSDQTSPPPDAAPTARTLLAFDATKGELPEGLVLDGDRAFMGFAPTGQVVVADLSKQPITATPFAKLPTPAPNMGFVTGLALDAEKRLLGGLVSFVGEPKAGIYRAPATGGDAVLFASHPDMVFPNGLAFRPDGTLLVTDSAAGAVFAVSPTGTVTPWAAHDLLKGKKDACGTAFNTFDIGANGLVLTANAAFVANNDYGAIVRIPIDASGAAGTPETFVASQCNVLGGADGLALDASGGLVVAVNRQDRLVRVSATKQVSVLAEGGVLDFPASPAVRGKDVLVTSFALNRASAGMPAKPALVSLPLP